MQVQVLSSAPKTKLLLGASFLFLEGLEGRVLNDSPGDCQTAPPLRPGVPEKSGANFGVDVGGQVLSSAPEKKQPLSTKTKVVSFQLNPPCRVGEIIFDDEIPFGDEIRLDGGWVDLISSAKQISSERSEDFITE